MIEASFTLQNTGQRVIIDVKNISSLGGYYNSILRLPIDFSLHPGQFFGSPCGFYISELEARLRFREADNIYVSTRKLLDLTVQERDMSRKIYVDFEIDPLRLQRIEAGRSSSMHFSLEMNLQVWTAEKFMFHSDRSAQARYRPMDLDIVNVNVHQELEVAQSDWVTKILPNWSWRAHRLVELPLSSDIIPESYELASNELTRAEKFFNVGDYDEAVGKCRSALDAIKKDVNEIRGQLSKGVEREWLETYINDGWEWIDKMYQRTHHLTSKTHHYPSAGHFDRQEAQMIYLSAVALIGYIGRMAPANNKGSHS